MKDWIQERKLESRWGLLGSGLMNLAILVVFFLVFWTVFMNPKGLLRMYTPMYGYAYEQWFLVAVLLTGLIYQYWPLSGTFIGKQHPLVKGFVLFALNIVFVLVMVNIVFQTIVGNLAIPYFSEDRLLALKINPYNAREYASTAILFMGAMAALIIPIWKLHLDSYPANKLEGVGGKHTAFLLIMFFTVVGFTLVLHPHFGIIFYPWQVYTSAFPWWEKTFQTLSGRFCLGWMMSWTATLWFVQITWEGYPFKLIQRKSWRSVAGILGTLGIALVLFAGFTFLQEVVWGPAVRGAKLIAAVDWRYLHSGETAMFMLLASLILGVYFRNWPVKFSVEVNILIRTLIVGVGAFLLYLLYYAVSPKVLGTQVGYSHPQQFPLAPLSILIAFLLAHNWYFDRWPGDRLVRDAAEADPTSETAGQRAAK